MDIAKLRKKLKEANQAKEADLSRVAESTIPIVKNKQRIEESPPTVREGDDEIALVEERAEEVVELLVFSLYDEEYAFKVSELEEIIRPQHITPIPRTPDYLIGVTSLRGKIIPIVDLKRRLLLTGTEDSKRQKIIILKGPKGPLGVMVDRISGVVRLPLSGLTDSPPHLDESQLRYIEQVALFNNRFISIINTGEITNIM